MGSGAGKGGGEKRGETGELRDLEKDPETKVRSNDNTPYLHVAPGQNRTMAIGAMVGGEQSHDYAIPASAECVC